MKKLPLTALALLSTLIAGACAVNHDHDMSSTPAALVGPVFFNDGGPLMVLAGLALTGWEGATDEDGLRRAPDRATE